MLVRFLKAKFQNFLENYLDIDPDEKEQVSTSLETEKKSGIIHYFSSKKSKKVVDKEFEKLLSFKLIHVKIEKFADMLKDLPLNLQKIKIHELVIDIPWKALFSKSVEIKVLGHSFI